MPAATADVPSPTTWPSTLVLKPTIDTTAHSIRFAGVDRYQTNLATNLGLRGNGGYPFSTPDPASGWWGVGACPRSIIVVAGDVFADALAASSLSDPTDRSSQPRLTVAASSDPTFIPVGSIDRPDTASAPIVVTQSARQGATALSATARSSAVDFNNGGCQTARQAIIVGGTGSVPTGVAQELVGLGYDEVFRVGGADRYDTAAQVAAALGTGSGTTATGCLDPDTTDGSARMGWYGNDVAEFRVDATSCELLPHAVVLADGGTGADALAAGWWTSFWQVPILLTAPDGSLPAATSNALSALQPSAIIVLGGTVRIPETTVDQAKSLAGGAAAGRVDGSDRYATSVAMAEYFGGWWPTGNAADFAGSLVCVAASGPTAGWPDALAAGPWCAAASGAASDPGAPARLLPPVDIATAVQVDPHVRPAHDAIPVLLVPTGSTILPDVTAALLTAAFPPTELWCASDVSGVCDPPGFAVAFGGPASVSATALAATADAVSGAHYATSTPDASPALTAPFITSLDLSPVFTTSAATPMLCTDRGSVSAGRWLVAESSAAPLWTTDLAGHPPFGGDADGVARSASSVPFCWSTPSGIDLRQVTGFHAVSTSGHRTATVGTGGERLTMGAPVTIDGPSSSNGLPSDLDPSAGGSTSWNFQSSSFAGVTITSRGQIANVTTMAASFDLERGTDGVLVGPDVVSGAVTITTSLGVVTGSFTGEGILSGGTWRVRGRVDWSGGTWNLRSGTGGFTADIQTRAGGTNGDDVLVWNADGLVR